MTKPRFTESDVVAIREAYATGRVRFKRLARAWNQTEGSIAQICHGQTWAQYGGPIAPIDSRPHLDATSLAELEVQLIRGDSYEFIADDFDITDAAVRYHAKRTGLYKKSTHGGRRFGIDHDEFARLVAEPHDVDEVCEALNCNRNTYARHIKRIASKVAA